MTAELDRRARACGQREAHPFVNDQWALSGEIMETDGQRFITMPKVWGVAYAYEIADGRLVSALAVTTEKNTRCSWTR
jgi:hypothetical protein